MSNKYIPPALRNKGTAGVKPQPAANEFPSLGSARVQNNQWKNKTSFAVLATEWSEHAEEEAEQRTIQKEREAREAERRAAEERMIISRKRHVDEIYEMEEDYEDDSMWVQTTARQQEDDAWTTVERKPKKELTPEEKFLRDQKREEEEKRVQTERDSVWDVATGSDWDYRDRRAVA